MEDDTAESGILLQVGRDPAITTALSFEQMLVPDFHKLPRYQELYGHLNAHHFIDAMLRQGDALGRFYAIAQPIYELVQQRRPHSLHLAAPHVSYAIKTARLISAPSREGK